jgi:hypothetical protein
MSTTTDTVEIPLSVLESVDTLDELEDWLMAHHPGIMAQLRQARQDDQAGKFQPWRPRFAKWPTASK